MPTNMTPQVLAGLKSRAVTTLGRAMPTPLIKRLIGDEWHEEIQMSIYRQLKALTRDVRRRTLREAALVAANPYSNNVAVIKGEEPLAIGFKIATAIQALERTSWPRRGRSSRSSAGRKVRRA